MSDTFNGVKYRPGFVKADYTKPITPEKLKQGPASSKNVETPEDGSLMGIPGMKITIMGQTITPDSIAILPEMLSIKDASERTNLSYEFIRYLIDQGYVKYVRSGNKFFVNSFSLAEYLNNAMGESEAEND